MIIAPTPFDVAVQVDRLLRRTFAMENVVPMAAGDVGMNLVTGRLMGFRAGGAAEEFAFLSDLSVGGGWTDDGAIVRLTTVADTVAIGAATMVGSEKVRIVGGSVFEGDITMNGNFDFVPIADGQGELGTDALRWNRVRAQTIVSGDLEMIDETRNAHWILREEMDRIVALNKKTGRRYRLMLEECLGD